MARLSGLLKTPGALVGIAIALAGLAIWIWQARQPTVTSRPSDPGDRNSASSGVGAQPSNRGDDRTIPLQAGELARLIAAYQALPSAADRSRYDVTARAALLGSDPEAAFLFVRDRIAEEIYPGVLRGASGALQAGAGNDLDKSLLLAELLAAHKHRIRYARCTLSADEAADRIAGLFEQPRTVLPDIDLQPHLSAALVRNGISQTRSAELLAARQSARSWIDEVIIRTARSDLDVLRQALAREGSIALQPLADPRIVEDARVHVWIQLNQNDTWRDLDPTVAAARGGLSPCKADVTFDQLPSDVYQTVRLLVRNEFLNEGGLDAQTVLEHQFRVSDLYGRVIHVVNVGVPSSGGLMSSSALNRYLPVVRMPDEVVVGQEFDATPSSGSAALTVLDAFGGGAEPAIFAGQRIEFVFEAPGRRTSTSRALIELVTPEQRASGVVRDAPDSDAVALSLTQTWAVAVTAGRVDPVAAAETVFGGMDGSKMGRAFDAPEGRDATDEDLASDRAQSEDALLAAYALSCSMTAERALDALGSSFASRLKLTRDQPMLTITNLGFRQRAHDGSFVSELNLDLRHDRVRVIPSSPAHAEEGAWANVLHGLVGGALEHHLPALELRAANTVDLPAQRRFDTSLAFRLAREQGIEIQATTGQEASAFLRESISNSGGVRLSAEITDSTAIVSPRRAVLVGDEPRFAMWAIDRRTGDLLALLDSGLRGQQTERSQLERLINFLERQIRRCVQNRRNMEVCRQMLQMWADAANRLRTIRNLPGRINVNNGRFTGFTF